MIKTVKLPILSTASDGVSKHDDLQLTASFATLDARVAAAAANEATIGRARGFSGRLEFAPIPALDCDYESSKSENVAEESRAVLVADASRSDFRSFLEVHHPTIVARLVWTWRSPELLTYLKRLIVDDRGDRAGFSPEVMSELLLLHEILDSPQEIDKWNVNARAF